MYWSMALRATQATLRGDLSMAERLARAACCCGPGPSQDAFGAEFLQKFVVRYSRPTVELVTGLRQATGMNRRTGRGAALAVTACAETGDPAEAVRIALGARTERRPRLTRRVVAQGALSLFCAGVAARAADMELAELLDELIAAPCSEHARDLRRRRGRARPGALLGGVAANAVGARPGDRHLDEAIHTAERIGAPFWAAQAQIDLAAVLGGGAGGRVHPVFGS